MQILNQIQKHKLEPKQEEFIFAPEQNVVYVAGIGTLKTSSMIKRGMILSQESPDNLGVIVRKNFTDLRDSTIRDFELETGLHVTKDSKEAVLNNGSVVMFRHGDELPALKNLNLGWFGIEQAEEFPDSTPWDMLQMRLRRKVRNRSGFLIANANGRNWIHKRFLDGAPKNTRVIQANTYEFKHLHPPDYFDRLETLPKKLFRRYVLNSHEEAEGLVYDEFTQARNVEEPFAPPNTWTKGIVIDHGFRNPTAVLWWAIDWDGVIHIYNEHYEREKPLSYHAQKIKEYENIGGICDPSMFARTQQKSDSVVSIADEYRDLGIILSPAIREEEKASVARVNEFLKDGRLKISKVCIETIREIENWKWKAPRPGSADNLKEVPEDKDNHACDAIKYLVSSRFGKPARYKRQPEEGSAQWYIDKKTEKKGYHARWRG